MTQSSTKKTSSIVAILAAILLLVLQQFGIIDKPNNNSNEQRPPTSVNSSQRADTISKIKVPKVVPKPNKNTTQPSKNTSTPIEDSKKTDKGKTNKYSKEEQTTKPTSKPTQAPQTKESGEQTGGSILAELGQKKIIYTRHAQCRMDCRYISESEIKDILKRGKINHRKSKPYDSPCPSYAVEGLTKDKQEVRIVFAKCDYATKVITAIDLERKYSCHCD